MQHLETSYTTHDGIILYLQAWMPKEPKAAILLVHGLGEHSGRYKKFAELLAKNKFSVFTFDGRGHGKSSKPKPTAYFADYADYLKDIDALFGKVKAFSGQLPAFIFGHSMGGGLVVSYVLNYKSKVKGIILSSALLKPGDNISKILIAVSGLVSKVAPKLKVVKLVSKFISRDPEEVKKYDEDPLVYHEAIPARTGYELLKMMDEIENKVNNFGYPVLIMHGSADQLTNPKGSEFLFANAASEDKEIKIYPELYHEILNEYGKDSIMDEIQVWLSKRTL